MSQSDVSKKDGDSPRAEGSGAADAERKRIPATEFMTSRDGAAILAGVPVFAGVPAPNRDALIAAAMVEFYDADEEIFQEGGKPDFLYIALDGRIGLFGSRGEGQGRARRGDGIVEVFEAGEPFLAPAVILNLQYLLTARTLDKARVLAIPSDIFREQLRQTLSLSFAVNQALSRHWRMVVTQVRDIKRHSAGRRLASYILSLAETSGNERVMRLPTTKGVLAARLGMAPESLSRALAELEDIGIETRGRQIIVSSMKRLRDYCNK